MLGQNGYPFIPFVNEFSLICNICGRLLDHILESNSEKCQCNQYFSRSESDSQSVQFGKKKDEDVSIHNFEEEEERSQSIKAYEGKEENFDIESKLFDSVESKKSQVENEKKESQINEIDVERNSKIIDDGNSQKAKKSEFPKIQDNSEENKENISTNSDTKTKVVRIKKKRGRKSKKKKSSRCHKKYSMDNINTKIKVSSFKCVINYVNKWIKNSKNERINQLKLRKLWHRFTKVVNKTIMKSLNSLTLGDIIKGKISRKYGIKKSDAEKDLTFNQKVFQIINKDIFLNHILSEKFKDFFKNIYYKGKRKITKTIKLDENTNYSETIYLTKEDEMFPDLLQKDKENDKMLREKLEEYAFKNFMPKSIFVVHSS